MIRVRERYVLVFAIAAINFMNCSYGMEKKNEHCRFLGYLIRDVIEIFAGHKKVEKFEIQVPNQPARKYTCRMKPFSDYVRLLVIKNKKRKAYTFFGVHKDDQEKALAAGFKKRFLAYTGLKGKKTIQLIGDSKEFPNHGTIFARRFLQGYFNQDWIIEYGYTGHDYAPKKLDVNSCLNEYVDKNPKMAGRVLANVVGDTKMAILNWGCYVSPKVTNFIVIYNDHGIGEDQTHFGDDIVISDGFLNNKNTDEVFCLEGGVQSFLQVSNSMALGLPVTCVCNLRTEGGRTFFSTAEFLHEVQKLFEKKEMPSKIDIKNLYAEYDKTHEAWDPNRPDAYTKKALFEKAMDIFVTKKAYQRVSKQCKFFNTK